MIPLIINPWIRQWASYQIRKIAVCACAGNAGNVFLATNFKGNRWLAIPACITARASCTCRDACRDRQAAVAGKSFPAFPAHEQPAILRIWQEAHGLTTWGNGWVKLFCWSQAIEVSKWGGQQCIFGPVNQKAVMLANRRPCLITYWQSHSNQTKAVQQSNHSPEEIRFAGWTYLHGINQLPYRSAMSTPVAMQIVQRTDYIN